MTDEPDQPAADIASPEAGRKPKDSVKALDAKWGGPVLAGGYAVVPSVILKAQARLHIDAMQLAVLIHLIDYWHRPDNMPWPKKATLAERLGVSEKTIQRAMAGLEAEGLIQREKRFRPDNGGRTSNRYDLSPLVERLKGLAEEMEAARVEAEKIKREATRPGLKKRSKPAQGEQVSP